MTQFNIGDTLTFRAFDEESYSRGYGAHWETLTSKISEIYYKIGYCDKITSRGILSENKTPAVGETIQYEIWDGEEGRGYGWFMAKKEGTVAEIVYHMDNGQQVTKENIKLKNSEPVK